MIIRTIIATTLLSILIPTQGEAFSQQRLIQMSCATGTSTHWPSKDQHNEMCAVRQLRQFMPIAPEGLNKEDINWVIKISMMEEGFKETKEVNAIFNAFNLYPFVKYTTPDNRGAIFIYGSLKTNKIIPLQKDFDKHTEKATDISVKSIQPNVHYYIDPIIRTSPYMSKVRFRQSHVKIDNLAYFIFYFEELVEDDFIEFIINSVDYQGIQSYVNHMIQQSSPIINKNE